MKRQAHLFGKKLASPILPDIELQGDLEDLRRVPSPAAAEVPIPEIEEASDNLTASSVKARKLWCEAGHF